MSGLTVVGDIKVLYDSVQILEQELKGEQEKQRSYYEFVVSEIINRLEKLEAFCFQEGILEEIDTSWDIVRAKRNYLLKSTDWTAVSGCTAAPMEWAEYRQKLRDLPQTFGAVQPDQVVWPVQPSTRGPHTLGKEEI